jgi:hypothetical protein
MNARGAQRLDLGAIRCPCCGRTFAYAAGVTPRRWFAGVPGARAVVCSPECAHEYDGNPARHAQPGTELELELGHEGVNG